MPNGYELKLLDDNEVYLGTQVECEFNDGSHIKCFELIAEMDFLLVSEYGANCGNPRILIFKRRSSVKLYVSHPVFTTPDIVKTAEYYSEKLGFRRIDYLEATQPHICLYRDGVEFILTQSGICDRGY